MHNERVQELDAAVIALGAVYAGCWLALIAWLAL